MELARLGQVALRRSGWQRAAALAISLWTFCWIGGQFTSSSGPTALGVLARLGSRLRLEGGQWAERLALAWYGGAIVLPVLAGVLWAATTERGQAPALFGWVAVMLGAERFGYQPAFVLALATLVSLIGVLWLAALTTDGFVDRRPRLVAPDVLRAGVVAAALSAVVPLLLPLQLVSWLGRAYLTQPPTPLHPNADMPARGGWSRVPHAHDDDSTRTGTETVTQRE